MKVQFFPLQSMNFLWMILLVFFLFGFVISKTNVLKAINLSGLIIFGYYVGSKYLDNHFVLNYMSLNHLNLLLGFLVMISFLAFIQVLEDKRTDVYVLNIFVLLGSLIILCSKNLIIIYLGLELQTFSLFILVSKNKSSLKSAEAGLKYFVFGALSSGSYLMGLYFFFLSGLSLNLSDFLWLNNNILINLGLLLILVSLAFKLALFPFHFWIPDIYEGSSWDVILLLSTLPKVSVLSVLLSFLVKSDYLSYLCLISVVVGVLGALNQTKMKRLLGYSGISHMGFMILGFNIIKNEGYNAGFIYLYIYILTIIPLVVLMNYSSWRSSCYIIEVAGKNFTNKISSLTWLILFLSIAGIPPLAGFISKWFILWNVLSYQYMFVSLTLILCSAIGVAYYLRIVKIVYFQKKSSYFLWYQVLNSRLKYPFGGYFILGSGIYISLFLMINFSCLISVVNYCLSYSY